MRVFTVISVVVTAVLAADSDYNVVNNDGSFDFRYDNPDSFHESHGTRNKVVQGVFGGRNPKTGAIDSIEYTAGARGFRPRGKNVVRKYDLSQRPVGPIGNKDDPYFDPYEDPSYNFQFNTRTYSRKEGANRVGDVKGSYSYFDDVGERHDVEYIAGKNTGFHVKTPHPDSNPNAYRTTYFRDPRKPYMRGRSFVQRGLDGSYRFAAVGPDQRRTETSDAVGNVRGSYTYKDEKGVQHSVHYIAGPNIGYRVLKNVKGPHLPTLFPFNSPDIVPPDFYDNKEKDLEVFTQAATSYVTPPPRDNDNYFPDNTNQVDQSTNRPEGQGSTPQDEDEEAFDDFFSSKPTSGRPSTPGGRPGRPSTPGGRPGRPSTPGGRPGRPSTPGGRPATGGRPTTGGRPESGESPATEGRPETGGGPSTGEKPATGIRPTTGGRPISERPGGTATTPEGRPSIVGGRPTTPGGRPTPIGRPTIRPARPTTLAYPSSTTSTFGFSRPSTTRPTGGARPTADFGPPSDGDDDFDEDDLFGFPNKPKPSLPPISRPGSTLGRPSPTTPTFGGSSSTFGRPSSTSSTLPSSSSFGRPSSTASSTFGLPSTTFGPTSSTFGQTSSTRPTFGRPSPGRPDSTKPVLQFGVSEGENGKFHTLVTNLGDTLFTVPPGVSVRAHVQNIDLIPVYARSPSPSEQYNADVEVDEEVQVNAESSNGHVTVFGSVSTTEATTKATTKSETKLAAKSPTTEGVKSTTEEATTVASVIEGSTKETDDEGDDDDVDIF